MPVTFVRSNPKLPHDAGKVALRRGPLVYCLEEADNGKDLHDIRVTPNASWKLRRIPKLLGGTVVLEGKALRTDKKDWKGGELYAAKRPTFKRVDIRAVPYPLWCNRKTGEMRVWLREV